MRSSKTEMPAGNGRFGGQAGRISNFWDSNGENEIDLIALNDFDKTATIAEVKRNPKKISLQALAMKAAAIQKQLAKYDVSLKALSLHDV